jgi:hypothetical protein
LDRERGAQIAEASIAMKRVLLAAVLTAIACSVAAAKSGTFSTLSASVASLNDRGPLYTTRDERIVSAIAGSILNIAAFANRFDEGDPFHVRNVAAAGGTAKFTLERRAEVFTVKVREHVWSPRSYGRLAGSFMADGAGPAVTWDPTRDPGDGGLGTEAPAEAIARENLRLSRLLQAHPRAPALHERAALLLSLTAARRAAADLEIRPILARMTAHLAVARALHGDVLSDDGELAERLLSQLAAREVGHDGPILGTWTAGPVTFGDTPRLSILPPL